MGEKVVSVEWLKKEIDTFPILSRKNIEDSINKAFEDVIKK